MNNVKERVKGFYEEHKVACKAAGAAGLMAVGSVIGWKYCCKVSGWKPGRIVIKYDGYNRVISDALDTYKGLPSSVLAMYDRNRPIKLENMGELGDLAKEMGLDITQELTHIMAFGKPIMDNN